MNATPGTIGWFDLTVQDATGLSEFYTSVVGWKAEPVAVGDHHDFMVGPPDADPVAGLCHALPPNEGLPAQWLMYIHVADLDAAVKACEAGGGTMIRAAQSDDPPRFAIIQDPAGAVCALYQAT